MTDPVDRAVTVEITGDRLIEVTWTGATAITGEVATAAMQRAVELDGGVGRPVLVVMHRSAEMTRAARTAFARFDDLPRLALLGDSAVDRMIANVVLRMATFRIPIRYFTDRAEAVAWLSDMRWDRTEQAGAADGTPPDPLS